MVKRLAMEKKDREKRQHISTRINFEKMAVMDAHIQAQ